MALVPFKGKKSGARPAAQDRSQQMPERMSVGEQHDQAKTAVGTGSPRDPIAAPPVDGSRLGHDPNYPRREPREY